VCPESADSPIDPNQTARFFVKKKGGDKSRTHRDARVRFGESLIPRDYSA